MLIEALIELFGELLATLALTNDGDKKGNKGCVIMLVITLFLIVGGIWFYYLTPTE